MLSCNTPTSRKRAQHCRTKELRDRPTWHLIHLDEARLDRFASRHQGHFTLKQGHQLDKACHLPRAHTSSSIMWSKLRDPNLTMLRLPMAKGL